MLALVNKRFFQIAINDKTKRTQFIGLTVGMFFYHLNSVLFNSNSYLIRQLYLPSSSLKDDVFQEDYIFLFKIIKFLNTFLDRECHSRNWSCNLLASY